MKISISGVPYRNTKWAEIADRNTKIVSAAEFLPFQNGPLGNKHYVEYIFVFLAEAICQKC